MKVTILRAAIFAATISTLFLSPPMLQTRATASQDTVIVEKCNESYQTSDLENLPAKCRWRIDYRTRAGAVWGSEVGSTMANVISKKDGTIATQRKMDELFGGNTAA